MGINLFHPQHCLGEHTMTEVNYTPELVVALTALSPVTYPEAVAFGAENGKSTRSVIAKVLSLNLDYLPKVVPSKRPKGVTKAELVAEIASRLKAEDGFPGLEKATMSALLNLVGAV
jgi:hypothetical protein